VIVFKAFHLEFPEIGITETRVAIQFDERGQDPYLFLELYCDEVGCDCRRVIVKVVSHREAEAGGDGFMASLSFGWEDEQFYRDWAGWPLDRHDLEELKGPGLQRLAPQSVRAEEMLSLFRVVLQDEAYVERLRRHYAMFRARVETNTLGGDARPTRPSRRERRAAARRKSTPTSLR
jgi:hypothetical protein